MVRKVGFDGLAVETAIENQRKKDKLIHVVLYGEDEDTFSDGIFFNEYPPKNPAQGKMWMRTSDSKLLLWYIDSSTQRGQWVETTTK